MKRIEPALSFTLVVLLVACSGLPGQEARQNPSKDFSAADAACSLLTKTDMEIMLGRKYAEGAGTVIANARLRKQLRAQGKAVEETGGYIPFLSYPGMTRCFYPTDDLSDRFDYVETGIVYAYADQVWRDLKTGKYGARPKMVPALGEEGILSSQRAVVRHGTIIFGIGYTSSYTAPPGDDKERVLRLVRKALQRAGPA